MSGLARCALVFQQRENKGVGVIDVSEILVTRKTSLRNALSLMDQKALGILLLVDDRGSFERTVTDGDLRRLVLDGIQLDDGLTALPRIQSQLVPEGASRREALDLMNKHTINHLPVIDQLGKVVGVLDRKEI